jgi:hypothetical protein
LLVEGGPNLYSSTPGGETPAPPSGQDQVVEVEEELGERQTLRSVRVAPETDTIIGAKEEKHFKRSN